ncbi:MAG: hypothetical protein JW760_00965 [Spirochaetales bacterium]|nr:hypothetical protein [Spirochaetales bacterium]
MKNISVKIYSFVAVLLMLGLIFSGCASLPVPTEAEVIDAIGVALLAYANGALEALTGSAEGVEYNTTTLVVTFTGYDVSGYGEGQYSSISGTVSNGMNGWTFDVTLTGTGAVETLSFITTSLDQATTITAVANGESFTVDVQDL